MRFGTIIADPPWPYGKAQRHYKDGTQNRAGGFSNFEYEPMSQSDLEALPVRDVAADDCVLLLWTVFPHLPGALAVTRAWGFEYRTALPWVKTVEITPGTEPAFKPAYGVGFWMRGCAELVILASRPKSPGRRMAWCGLLSDNAKHSRKPDTLYELAEGRPGFENVCLPGPRLELFARRRRDGWTQLGNELEGDGEDVRTSLPALARA